MQKLDLWTEPIKGADCGDVMSPLTFFIYSMWTYTLSFNKLLEMKVNSLT